ncbi:MAG: shikimate kinase [Clostridiales bacterium]|jgi:shikimate kinase|nr:shikimate kinase [Clostridiales bacterium]
MILSNNIVLIGFMGSGKTSVGRFLSERLAYSFKDTDQLIEAQQAMTIQKIFSIHGEEYFRNLETELLLSLKGSLDKVVLSTGGGMPIRDENVKLLNMMGPVIYLQASSNTIISRVSGDGKRPLLEGDDLQVKVEKLLLSRQAIYERSASSIINTDNKSIEEIGNEILDYCKLG